MRNLYTHHHLLYDKYSNGLTMAQIDEAYAKALVAP